ncbi:hypothetical protein PFISCL1PPCAC_11734, partial [Pristionchus fissidentatus]
LQERQIFFPDLKSSIVYRVFNTQSCVMFHFLGDDRSEVLLRATKRELHKLDERRFLNISIIHGVIGNAIFLGDGADRIHKIWVVDGTMTIDSISHSSLKNSEYYHFFYLNVPYYAVRAGMRLSIYPLDQPSTSFNFTDDGINICDIDDSMDKHISTHSVVHKGRLVVLVPAMNEKFYRMRPNLLHYESPLISPDLEAPPNPALTVSKECCPSAPDTMAENVARTLTKALNLGITNNGKGNLENNKQKEQTVEVASTSSQSTQTLVETEEANEKIQSEKEELKLEIDRLKKKQEVSDWKFKVLNDQLKSIAVLEEANKTLKAENEELRKTVETLKKQVLSKRK